MREIKFRFFDKRYSKMKYQHDGDLVGDMDMSGGDDFGWWMTSPDIERMQFTGLKDKNGKEIYEGDICKVVDENGPWNVAAQEMHSLDAFHFWNHVSENIEDGVSYEIIGNIYENLDLLTIEPVVRANGDASA